MDPLPSSREPSSQCPNDATTSLPLPILESVCKSVFSHTDWEAVTQDLQLSYRSYYLAVIEKIFQEYIQRSASNTVTDTRSEAGMESTDTRVFSFLDLESSSEGEWSNANEG